MIRVEASPTAAGWDCAVAISEGENVSRHNVRVSKEDLQRWGRPGDAPEHLVRQAFDFLLKHERADQIKLSFELAEINQYFPEFEREFANR
ncbi:MAG: hypothetical protein ACR2MZ_00335 [Candidatus Dormibacter sp.]|uniref:hypothetical protein n=1 Tax=Candidatus Dormibacter sp. TaxID=2973982 RepID=UPI000DB51EF8|nr:MAG: hypothetical protein DLM66_01610 [Candidatus Dormibacteraeota bacterium]